MLRPVSTSCAVTFVFNRRDDASSIEGSASEEPSMSDHFDRLAQLMTTTFTRRRLLARLVAGITGGLVATLASGRKSHIRADTGWLDTPAFRTNGTILPPPFMTNGTLVPPPFGINGIFVNGTLSPPGFRVNEKWIWPRR
jgi:hypothetical protein